MTDPILQIREVVEAVRIRAGFTYSWLGMPAPRHPRGVRLAMSAEQARDQLLVTLQSQLYNDFYRHGCVTAGAHQGARSSAGAARFVEDLSRANAGRGRWEDGWQFVRRVDDDILATRHGVTVGARGQECRGLHELSRQGSRLDLASPKEFRLRAPGFYSAASDLAFDPGAEPVVRLYWNIEPSGAPRLVHEATALLNGASLAFGLKVVSDPQNYERCDSAVLYVRSSDWDRVRPILRKVFRAVAAHTWDAVPAFTLPLGPGVSVAEDPANGESFGMQRCQLLAEGLLGAFERGVRSTEARVGAVCERFGNDGVDVARPHLNPGSAAAYGGLTLRRPGPARTDRPARRRGVPGADPSGPPAGVAEFRHVAEAIGSQLCRDAIWHEDRCSWVGADPAERRSAAPSSSSALGPTLYRGTAGIAWFLAQLTVSSRFAEGHAPALGAARHALSQAHRVPEPERPGLYLGTPGIALAVAHVGQLLDDPELTARAAGLARELVEPTPSPDGEFDLLNGVAGAIVALVALADLVGDPCLVDGAERLGSHLLAAGRAVDGGLAWSSPANPKKPALTGLSHGAAGAALAFCELYAVTKEDRWRAGALGALDYERRWFDAGAGNWRDLRGLPGSGPFMTAWCHGAPGIALSRLRSSEVLGDDLLRHEAAVATATTRRAVEARLLRSIDDFSLCHGLSGNADVLLESWRRTGSSMDRTVALAAARAGIARYGQDAMGWPCGTRTGQTPALMIGLAGIGTFYLRLADAAVPTPLLPARAPDGKEDSNPDVNPDGKGEHDRSVALKVGSPA